MAIPSTPATPEQMQIEAIQELDRMRMMSIQSLAMQRIRDSVITLSRETGFRERPVEQFAQAPLYIPQYQQWSNTQQKLVGMAPPSAPNRRVYKSRGLNFGTVEEELGYLSRVDRTGRPWAMFQSVGTFSNMADYRSYMQSLQNYQTNYAAWQQAQRTLPA